MSTPMEGLRQLVGSKNWDYCILWKLSEDQRFLEFMDCCCGSEAGNIENETIGEELLFTCRDGMFAHPRTTTCEVLSQFPSSQHLDGINMEILISNQPRWLNFSNVSGLNVNEESLGTKVLIPIPGGLAELYAAKQVAEDLNVIDYVMAQCNILAEQGQMSNLTDTVPGYSINMNMVNEVESNMNESQAQMTFTNAIGGGTLNFCDGTDFSMNNFLQQFNYASENPNKTRNDFLEGENGSFQANHHHQHVLDKSENGFQGAEKGSVQKQDGGRVGSVSDSEQLDDDEEDEPKYRRRGAKGPQAKNLVAERKRRKKLNERLYILRSLVPNISKLDKAAILVDAIAYVQELQKEAEDLQDELNRNSDDEGTNHNIMADLPHNHHYNNFPAQVSNGNAPLYGPDYDHEKPTNGFRVGENESLKGNYDPKNANDKTQQMEVQVEVGQLEGNDFYVKVFGEQKRGGIVRLMEALNGLGLEITNVNMTSCISLVSYVFIVKKRDSENFHAEYLRDSLMEATRNCQAEYWTEMAKPSENGDGIDHRHQQHLRVNHQLETFHSHFHHHLVN